jgi:cyclophilin family peptidyl-prolyl cis-trans isomerase
MTRPHSRVYAALTALAVVGSLALGACTGGVGSTPALPSLSLAPSASEAATGPHDCPTSQPPALPAGESRTVTIQTKLGDIVIKVDGSLSPIAAGNFVALAECGYYDGVDFHRVVPGFVVQGGDGQYGREPNVQMSLIGTGGPGYTIKDEPVTAPYGRGVVAMARTQAPDSQGSQFFIVTDDKAQAALKSANTYAIFGHVTSGMDVVDAITASADAEIPTHPVAMQKVTVANP